MRMIVTGACGFIGSVFMLRAHERGHQVIGIDNMTEGLNARGLRRDGLEIIQADCGAGFQFPEALKAVLQVLTGVFSTLDVVAHFAPTDVAPVLEDSKKLNAAWLLCPVEHMSDVVRVHQQSDDKNKPMVVPLKLYNVIGAYKGLTERRISRLTVLPALARSYATFRYHQQPFTIHGNDWDTRDGTPARDYIHVLDVVDHLLDLVEGKIETYVMPDGAVHFGTGRTTTVFELVEMLRQWYGRLETQIGPRLPNDFAFSRCPKEAVIELTRWRMLAPAWVSVRDELEALLE